MLKNRNFHGYSGDNDLFYKRCTIPATPLDSLPLRMYIVYVVIKMSCDVSVTNACRNQDTEKWIAPKLFRNEKKAKCDQLKLVDFGEIKENDRLKFIYRYFPDTYLLRNTIIGSKYESSIRMPHIFTTENVSIDELADQEWVNDTIMFSCHDEVSLNWLLKKMKENNLKCNIELA